MKPHRDAASLAAALTSAAAAPLPLPVKPEPPANDPVAPSAPRRSTSPTKAKATPDTVGITLRPDRALLLRYTHEAAERTRREGRVISAQQIMLEVLARGLKVQS